MDRQAGIGLDFAGIGFIVVNTVAIECQGGVPEQQHGIDLHDPLRLGAFPGVGESCGRMGGCGCAINDILPFPKRDAALSGQSVPDCHEAK